MGGFVRAGHSVGCSTRSCVPAWQPGLVKGEGFAVDASIIEAEAGSKLAMPGDEPSCLAESGPLCKRAVREYLEGLEQRSIWRITIPKRISLADPQSSWTAAPGGPAFFAYSTNYLIDVAHGVIVDVEATLGASYCRGRVHQAHG